MDDGAPVGRANRGGGMDDIGGADGTHSRARPAKRPPCPICGRPNTVDYRPFCSKRCADVDLGRWLTGSYAVPGGPVDEDEDGISQNSGRVGAFGDVDPDRDGNNER